jgi:hypothetical protein
VSQRSLPVASCFASRRFLFRQRAKRGPFPPESGPREAVKEQRTSGRGGDGAQLFRDAREEVFHWSGGAQGQHDAADADADEGGHLQQLEPKSVGRYAVFPLPVIDPGYSRRSSKVAVT